MDNLPAIFWEQKYQQGQTPWDIGYASPAIVQYFETVPNKQAAILIPGCGNAHEALALAKMGFTNICILDIVPTVIEKVQQLFEKGNIKINAICVDFFAFDGQFDYIVEQTFFCALLPTQRLNYARKMQQLLRPNGLLVGVLFNREFEQAGPPFGGSVAEYEHLFRLHFSSARFSPCINSIKPRMGAEVWMQCR